MNWDETQKLYLIEQYVQGTLSTTEQAEFAQLRAAVPEIEEDIQFHQKFWKVQPIFGRAEQKRELQLLEAKIQKEESLGIFAKLKSIFKQNVEQVQFTIDELITMFQPAPQYAGMLAQASRSDSIEVTKPVNSYACTKAQLDFKLAKAPKNSLQLSIENNQQQTLSTQTIEASTTQFSVPLNNFLPGRYYWKLTSDKDMVICEFFVQKDLMP